MRYINREYGFSFRPPFFDKFYEESVKGPAITEANFPGRYIIGAGLDYSAINGAMLVGKNGSLWGIKVSYLKGNKWLDNDHFLLNLGASSANTADGSFAHFASGPLSVKWARHTEQGMGIEIKSRKRLRVRVIFYPCYKWPCELSIEGSFVKGRSPYVAVIPGDISLTDSNAVYRNRYQVVLDDKAGKEYFKAQSYSKPLDTANGAFNEVIMEFILNSSQPSIYLYAAIGDEKVLGLDVPRLDKIAKLIETAELRYGVGKTFGSGELGVSTESMLNSVMWSRIYYPYLMDILYSPTRSTLSDHFDISGLEENGAALLGSYIGDSKTSETQLQYTMEDKIMAVLSMWHVFAHIKDKINVIKLYSKLTKLYPPDKKLVIADETKNEIAYKWTDSPLKETHIKQNMYSLDMSCLKLLAFDILERIAVRFDLPEAKAYSKSKSALTALINEIFWNPEKQIYTNRYVSGAWAQNYGATSFYPLIAGAVNSPERLTKLAESFADPKRFYGDYTVPTLSKDNRKYARPGIPNSYGKKEPPFLQYRGSIAPYVNYLIYHGLVRYGFDELAGDLARKSVRLWSNNKNSNVENYSLYLPTGKRVKQKEYLSNNGAMLALIGMQELIDVDYFRNDLKYALRFGTLCKGKHSITNLKLLGVNYSIDVSDTRTILLVNNEPAFVADGGKCVVRQFSENANGCQFSIYALNNLNLTVTLPLVSTPGRKSITVSFFVPEGKSKVLIEDGIPTIQVAS